MEGIYSTIRLDMSTCTIEHRRSRLGLDISAKTLSPECSLGADALKAAARVLYENVYTLGTIKKHPGTDTAPFGNFNE